MAWGCQHPYLDLAEPIPVGIVDSLACATAQSRDTAEPHRGARSAGETTSLSHLTLR